MDSRFTRRDFLRLAGVASGAAVLAACAPAPATKAPEEEVAPTKEVAIGPVKITWVGGQYEDYLGYRDATENRFTEETGIEVEFGGFGPDPGQKIMAMLNAKDASWVVFQGDIEDVTQVVKAGWFQPLDGLFDKEWTDDLVQWDFHEYEGQHYGVNWVCDTTQLYWRKDVFEEVGLDPDQPPTTFEEIYDFGKKCVKQDAAGNVERWGSAIWVADESFMSGFMRYFGAKVWEDGYKASFNTEEGVHALSYLKKLFTDNVMSPDPGFNQHAMFLDGNLAISWQYPYFYPFAEDQFGAENVGVSRLVEMPYGAVYGHTYYINPFATSEQIEAAAKALQFYVSTDFMGYLVSVGHQYAPPQCSTYTDQALMATRPEWQALRDQLMALPALGSTQGWGGGYRNLFTAVATMDDVKEAIETALPDFPDLTEDHFKWGVYRVAERGDPPLKHCLGG